MATIVRVKRRKNEDPIENLTVSCKRRKEEAPGDSASSAPLTEGLESCLNYAGTVESTSESVSQRIRDAIRKVKLEKEYKLHTVQNTTAKGRIQQKKNAKAQRFKIISSLRSKDLDKLDKPEVRTEDSASNNSVEPRLGSTSDSDRMFQLLDVESPAVQRPLPTYESLIQESANSSGITCNTVPLERHSSPSSIDDQEYVYDLYYTNNRDFNFRALESALTIQAFTEDNLHNIERLSDDDSQVYDDEDDSNDEGNWRNDYPDEDPLFFENQDLDYRYGDDVDEREIFNNPDDAGLSEWMHSRCNIEDGNDLSSEEEDFYGEPVEGFVHSDRHGYTDYYTKVSRDLEQYSSQVVPGGSDDENPQ